MAGTTVRKYIITESVISMLFNAVFSFGVTYLFFKGQQLIQKSELIVDALPQTFFVTFFGTLVPTLVTRARLRTGRITSQPYRKTLLPNNALPRAISMGIMVSLAGYAVHFLVINALGIETLTLSATLTYKTLYGAALSWLVTPWALNIAFRDHVTTP